MSVQLLSIVLAGLSLLLSVATAWATLWRSGRLKMARPPTIYFGPDGSRPQHPKIFLRGLLYTTARRGRVIETMFARVRRGESSQTFNIWVHGERDKLRRGSGLFVGSEGVACDHHFLLPADGTRFQFLAGEYSVEVHAQPVGATKAIKLADVRVEVTEDQCRELSSNTDVGLYFDWGPDARRYVAHLDRARLPAPAPAVVVLAGRESPRADPRGAA